MLNVLTTILACALLGTTLREIDGGYLYIASFGLGAFILGAVLTLTLND